MIEKIIEWSINNKFLVILATVFVILGGFLALKHVMEEDDMDKLE